MIETNEMQKSLELEAKKGKGKIYLLLFVLALSIFIYFYYFYKKNNQNEKVEYVTKEIVRKDLSVMVSATGNLEPTNSVDIGIEVSGTIKEIYVDFNDEVKVGQILAKLDTTKLQSKLNSAKAGLAIAKANLAESEVEVKSKLAKLKRAEEMYKTSKGKYPSINEMDDYKFSYEASKATHQADEARVEQSLFEVRSAEDDLRKAVVVSSIDGIVLNRAVEIGQTVAATMQAPVLFTLARDLSKMELIVSVDEADIGNVKKALDVTFSVDAYPNRVFNGTIKQVRLKPQEVSGVITYDTVVSVENREFLLKPGMTATAQIITKNLKDKLLIPNSALRFTPKAITKDENRGIFFRPPRTKEEVKDLSKKDERSVWILRDGKPYRVIVKILDSDGRFSAIKDGELKESDKVIISQKRVDGK